MPRKREAPPAFLPAEAYTQMLQRQFDLQMAMPLSWLLAAWKLRRSADLVFATANSAHLRDMARLEQELQTGTFGSGSRTLQGQELLDAHDSALWSVYLMLIGMGIECLLKGLIASRDGPASVRLTHDLADLAAALGDDLTPREWELLDILSDHIEWQGRYPAPTKVEKLGGIAGRGDPSGSAGNFRPPLAPGWTSASEDDHKRLNNLFDRYRSRLDDARKNSSPSG